MFKRRMLGTTGLVTAICCAFTMAPAAALAYYERPVCVSLDSFVVVDPTAAAEHLAAATEGASEDDASSIDTVYRVVTKRTLVVTAPGDVEMLLCPTIGEGVVDTSTAAEALRQPPQPTVDLPDAEWEVVILASESPVFLPQYGAPSASVDHEQNDPPSSNWRRNTSGCANVKHYAYEGADEPIVTRTVCWRLDQQLENDPARRYYQFEADVSGSGQNKTTVERMWVEAKRYDHAVPMEFDAMPSPAEDRPGSQECQTTSESLSVMSGAPVEVGFGYSTSRVTCEDYLVKQYGEHGHWASVWEGNPSTKGTRHIGLNMPVRASQSDTRRAEWLLLTGQKWG